MSSKNFAPRDVFKQAKLALAKAGFSAEAINKASLTQSYLRLELVASTSKTSYQFGVLTNDTPNGSVQRATENRLNLQDMFITGSLGLMIGLADSATATDFDLYTWNDPNVFSTSGAAQALNNLYNGKLSYTVNNNVLTPSWDLWRHKMVPQTQTQAAASGIIATASMKDGWSDTFVPVEPNWIIQGQKNNQLTIDLPAAIGTLQASKTTVLTLIARGVLAQNVTVVS